MQSLVCNFITIAIYPLYIDFNDATFAFGVLGDRTVMRDETPSRDGLHSILYSNYIINMCRS